MAQTPPVNPDELPPTPSTSTPTTFAGRMDSFLAALAPFRAQLVALATTCFNNAVDAYNNAVAAAASASAAANSASTTATAIAASGANPWVSNTPYTAGNKAVSLIDWQVYVRVITGGGTTDPKLDGVNWTRFLVGPGVGGTTSTGSLTLTASSAAAIHVSPSAPGMHLTLPVATTCIEAASLFCCYNAGDYDYGVRDSSGVRLGWLRPQTGCMIGLADNTTSAGVWSYYGLEKTAITASYVNTSLTNMVSTGVVRVSIDTDRTLFLFGGTDCYGVIYDDAAKVWGAPALIRAGLSSGAFLGILSNANQVLVVCCNTTSWLYAITLTISGTSFTVNTPASVILSGAHAYFGNIIAVGSSWVVSYGRATTTSGICAITISGTTPTIGAESVISAATSIPANIYAAGSTVRTFVLSSSTMLATPYTVSGSSLTLGTAATATSTNTEFRTFLNGNGNIVSEYFNTTHYATIFKLSGTTEAASSVSLGTVTTSLLTYCDYAQVSTGQTLFTGMVAGNTWYANILIDTAGTASVGTEISVSAPNGLQSALVSYNVTGSLVSAAAYCGGKIIQVDVDCSGPSAVLASTQLVPTTSNVQYPVPSDKYGVRAVSQLSAGLSAILLNSGSSVADGGIGDIRLSSGMIQTIRSQPLAAQPNAVNGVVGASNSESFLTSTYISTTGFVIQKVEAAA